MSLGKLALGIGRGLAGYYGKVAEQEMETRKIDLLAKREMALSVFNSGLRREEAAIAAEEQRKSYTHKVTTDVGGEAALLPAKTKAEIEVARGREAAGFARDAAKEEISHKNRIELEKLTSRLDMDETRNKAALDLQNELTVAGKKADRWEVTNDGAMVAFNSRGEVIGKTPKNVFVPPSRGGGDDEDILGGAPAGRGGRPILTPRATGISPTAKAAPANPQLEQALADLGQFYPNATPDRFPALFRNGRKIPITEAEKIVRARFGS